MLSPNYVRACFLEGQVTDAVTGQSLGDVEVVIQSTQANLGETDNFGEYKTGQAIPGTFTVRFTKLGYYPVEAEAVLENGEVTILDVQMTPLATYSVSGFSVQDEDGQPIPNAKISFVSETANYNTTSDNNGGFSIAAAFEGQYTVYAGVWGRLHAVLENVVIDATTEQLVVPLKEGYQDDFLFELGWEKTADGSTDAGFWVRAVPILTTNNGEASNPGSDVADDLGTECYVTGNAAGNVGAADVDGGKVYLTSPVMNLSDYQDPVISYNLWFYNSGGNSTPDDSLVVRVSNGLQSIVLETVKESSSAWRSRSEFHLASLIELTENMQVTFETGDLNCEPTPVEGGVDAFLVVDAFVNGTDETLPVVSAGIDAQSIHRRHSASLPFRQSGGRPGYLDGIRCIGKTARAQSHQRSGRNDPDWGKPAGRLFLCNLVFKRTTAEYFPNGESGVAKWQVCKSDSNALCRKKAQNGHLQGSVFACHALLSNSKNKHERN